MQSMPCRPCHANHARSTARASKRHSPAECLQRIEFATHNRSLPTVKNTNDKSTNDKSTNDKEHEAFALVNTVCDHVTRRSLTRASTTDGSARVEVSPSWSGAFSAILRKIRRMILPLRVFGSPDAHWI